MSKAFMAVALTEAVLWRRTGGGRAVGRASCRVAEAVLGRWQGVRWTRNKILPFAFGGTCKEYQITVGYDVGVMLQELDAVSH